MGLIKHIWRSGTEGKICTNCGEWRVLEEYHRSQQYKDGLAYYCKMCKSEVDKQYRQQNKEQITLRKHQYRKTHREQLKTYYRAYYQAHKEELADYYRRYRSKHKKKIAAYKRRYYAMPENQEAMRAYRKHYRTLHREELRAKDHVYYLEHTDKIKARSAKSIKRYRKEKPHQFREYCQRRRARLADVTVEPVDRQAIFERDNHSCVYCGSPDSLGLDHVIPLMRDGTHCEKNLVVACQSCNSSKGTKLLKDWVRRID